MAIEIEIICIGNELLIGKTLNTNAHWLAKRVTSLGGTVKRVSVVGDEIDEIASAIRDALKRKPRFIITTGGLGPTFDDKTLAGIAKALRRRLSVNEDALKMIRQKYVALREQGRIGAIELTPARVKMATFPSNADPLHNSVGTAPGMLAHFGGTALIALPGVPPEMEAIFDSSAANMIKKEAGSSTFFEKSLYVVRMMESNLAPLIEEVMHDNPHIYIKSHVYGKSHLQGEGQEPCIELHFSTTANDRRIAKHRLTIAIRQLSRVVVKNGGRVEV